MRIAGAPEARRTSAARWAARAIRRELLDFSFSYAIEEVDTKEARGLRYHIASDRLFFDAMECDADGVAVQRSRTLHGVYNPAYVAWYGLAALDRFARGQDGGGDAVFLAQLAWLRRSAVRRPDGAIVWHYGFDWEEGRCQLRAPWISAMSQGLAISALVRGARLTGRRDLLGLAVDATRVFDLGLEAGGVATREDGRVLYEEYPARPLPRVLDGFMFGLLGLYDVAEATGDRRARELFEAGVDGLVHTLPRWSVLGRWSWYGTHGYLCPPHYNALNVALLRRLAELGESPSLARCAEGWGADRRSLAERVAIYTAFVLTKNGSRLRRIGRRALARGVRSKSPRGGRHALPAR